MNIQQQIQIVEDNLNEYGQCNITLEEFNFLKEKIRAEAIEQLFNAEFINGMTLKDVYEEVAINEFDEGWDRCYEDFVEVAERLNKKK